MALSPMLSVCQWKRFLDCWENLGFTQPLSRMTNDNRYRGMTNDK